MRDEDITATYTYVSEDGTVLFEVVRFEPEGEHKTFRQRRPKPDGGWDWTLEGVQRVPYHVDQLSRWQAQADGLPVILCEGEKDVDRLLAEGFRATTTPQGAANWREEYAEWFHDLEVIVVPDADTPGREYAKKAITDIFPHARSVRFVELPGVAEHGDVSDWLDDGHDAAEFRELCRAAPRLREPADMDKPPPPKLEIRWIKDALLNPPPEPEVLIEGFLRRGELAVLGAPRGIGKSWFAENLAVLGGRGEGKLGGTLQIARPVRVLLAQGEVDEWEAARRWKMLTGVEQAPGGVAESFDQWRLRVVKRRTSTGGSAEGDRWSESDEYIDASLDERLEATVAEHKFDLLVIDPWAVFFSGNENSNDEVEAGLGKLRDLSMRYALAVLILHHIRKGTDAREPEDMWRGASRLADWASTRCTILPHYTEKQAADQGMTRQQSRRFVDVNFLRRSAPTPDFAMKLNDETGWWEHWMAPADAAAGRRVHLELDDITDALRASGGTWTSLTSASDALGKSRDTVKRLLDYAVREGAVRADPGPRRSTIYRLPDVPNNVTPLFGDDEPPDDDGDF